MAETTNEVFTAYVHVTDANGQHHPFTPGDPVPGWAIPLTGDHCREPVPEYYRPDPREINAGTLHVDIEPFFAETVEGEIPKRPPTSGPGSGRQEWITWGKAVGLDTWSAMTRQDVMDAAIRAGIIRDHE
jgi:hypothetical protein